jgi:hypothetical protein
MLCNKKRLPLITYSLENDQLPTDLFSLILLPLFIPDAF